MYTFHYPKIKPTLLCRRSQNTYSVKFESSIYLVRTRYAARTNMRTHKGVVRPAATTVQRGRQVYQSAPSNMSKRLKLTNLKELRALVGGVNQTS